MQRYNIFSQAHKGLKAMLYSAALGLQQTDFVNSEEAETSFSAVEQVLAAVKVHTARENKFILPVLKKIDINLADEFEKEHQQEEALVHRLTHLLPVYSRAVCGDAKLELGNIIQKAFIEFVVFSLYHMNKEESKINEALWASYSDDVIMGIYQSALAAYPPAKTDESKWIMRGISNNEIIHWLKKAENSAPCLECQGLLSLAENELPAQRWNIIKEALIEGTMVV